MRKKALLPPFSPLGMSRTFNFSRSWMCGAIHRDALPCSNGWWSPFLWPGTRANVSTWAQTVSSLTSRSQGASGLILCLSVSATASAASRLVSEASRSANKLASSLPARSSRSTIDSAFVRSCAACSISSPLRCSSPRMASSVFWMKLSSCGWMRCCVCGA